MDREEALAVAFANLKGSKDKDLLATAEALALLRSLPEYTSNAAVGRATGVSGEIVREFIALTKLPPEIQEAFRKKKLKLEHGRRLAQLSARMPEKVSAAASAMKDLTAMESRDLIEYLLDHPEASVAKAKKAILQAKTITQEEIHVIAMLSPDEFGDLSQRARKARKPVNDLVSSIVRDWLVQKGN